MIKFKEIQQIGIILRIILIVLLIIFFILYKYVNEIYIIGVNISFIFSIISQILKLEVNIYNDRIEYRLFPFHISFKVIMLNNIKTIDIITSKQIGVYGFKIKNNLSSTVYYFGGDNILRITLNNKKTVMLGTQQIKEIKKVLNIKDY